MPMKNLLLITLIVDLQNFNEITFKRLILQRLVVHMDPNLVFFEIKKQREVCKNSLCTRQVTPTFSALDGSEGRKKYLFRLNKSNFHLSSRLYIGFLSKLCDQPKEEMSIDHQGVPKYTKVKNCFEQRYLRLIREFSFSNSECRTIVSVFPHWEMRRKCGGRVTL